MSREEPMKYLTRIVFTGLLALLTNLSFLSAQVRLTPSNWWTDLGYNKIIVIAQGQQIGSKSANIQYPGVRLIRTLPAENPNYLFLELEIDQSAKAGVVTIQFSDGSRSGASGKFSLKNRNKDYQRKKLSQADAIYQIVPDRFCDGDTKNNNPKHYYERTDRLNPAGVHGGDLPGITSHIDYIQQLGFTAIDLLPVAESNQMISSYHRMGATNLFKVDERLGSNQSYEALINKCHQKNIKVIQSLVLHQLGKQHPLYKEQPFSSWFYPASSNYMDEIDYSPLTDPYATASDFNNALQQWEEMGLPVLNQTNELVQSFLLQHAIWWVETFKLDGIRIEQTPRNHPQLIDKLLTTLEKNYPELSVITDTPAEAGSNIAYWQCLPGMQKNSHSSHIYTSDYPLALKASDAFSTFRDANDGMMDLYNTLAADYCYQNPENNIVFIDNHKLTRAYTNADKELNQLKMMLGYIMTTRGIPCMLYGTELLLDGNINKGAGFVRKGFPGGWTGDAQNGFTQQGISPKQHEIQQFINRLINWRKNNTTIHNGHFQHYKPADGIYVYGKLTAEDGVIVIINNSDTNKWRLVLSRYKDMLGAFSSAQDILTGNTFEDLDDLLVLPKSIMILELQ